MAVELGRSADDEDLPRVRLQPEGDLEGRAEGASDEQARHAGGSVTPSRARASAPQKTIGTPGAKLSACCRRKLSAGPMTPTMRCSFLGRYFFW